MIVSIHKPTKKVNHSNINHKRNKPKSQNSKRKCQHMKNLPQDKVDNPEYKTENQKCL